MSRVFVAEDRALGRKVAVKVLSREVAAEVKTERFRLEIQLAAKLHHPHIVPLLQSGEVDGILYYTMPFIDGESLRARIDRDGAMSIGDGIRTLRHVASALSFAHKHGVVHRDIKPDNVLLAGEFALVTDFGVARAISASTESGEQRLTSTGIALGTPAYMSPEQALADPEIDHRADIYAFGVLAYEVFTGAPPFRGKSAQATLAAHVIQPPDELVAKRADLPAEVASVVMACLAKKPSDRPQTAGELLQIFDTATSGSRSQAVVAPVPSRRESGWSRWAAVALAVIAISVLLYTASKRAGAGGGAGSGDFNSVAVLPLVNVGADKTDEYFSDGMTDELANALAKLPGIKVASRTSTYAFKGQNTDVSEIGRKLKVQTVLEGTVQRAGPRLRVRAQLTNVSDGLALWSEKYERETRDVFSVQDDIARSIAEALKLRLGPQARRIASTSRGTEDLGAFDSYLRGRFFWNARGAENLRRAISYFDSAIASDPSFARAHAARAIAYALLPEYTDSPPRNVSALTYDAADRALSLDSTLAEAYTARGLANVHDWKYKEAYAAYRKALALEPRYATAHQWYGELLMHTGQIDSSLVQMRMAAELDPLAPILPSALGQALIVARQYDAAIAELRKGIELAPNLGLHHALLGNALAIAGRHAEAVPEMEAAARLDPELAQRQGFLVFAYGRAGRLDKAREVFARLQARPATDRISPVALALAHLGLGENDRALDELEKAVALHDIALLTAATPLLDPLFDPLRANPRFTAILERMNLGAYMRARQPK